MKVSWNGAPRRVTVPFIIDETLRTVLAERVAFFGIRALKGGKFHPKLNMTTRLIANKYREGKAKRTLKRELKVLEIVKGEANIAVESAHAWIACWFGSALVCQGNRSYELHSLSSWFLHVWEGSTNLALEAKPISCFKVTALEVLLAIPVPGC